MLKKKTTLIIGAGASAEAGLPIGSQLKTVIAKKLNFQIANGFINAGFGDQKIYEEIQRNTALLLRLTDFGLYIKACIDISTGITLSSSIDNFIDTHKHDQLITKCGKLAIARSILEAERGSKLHVDPSNINNTINFKPLIDTWYFKFYEWLSNNIDKSQLSGIFKNLTVISFNYDRCIQHFLVHAISKNYLLPIQESIEIVKSLKIYFPYGSVGSYLERNNEYANFGDERTPNLESALTRIKTYTEQIEENSTELQQIRNAISEAEILIFLGNNYHDTNIDLLCSPGIGKEKRQILFGTRKGIDSTSDLNVVKNKLQRLNGNYGIQSLSFSDTCNDLFREYGRSMRAD